MTAPAKSPAEHTPTPLSIQFEPHNGFGGSDPDGEPWPFGYISTAPLPLPIFELRPTLAFTSEEFRAYATLIVKAVNSHPTLVDALKDWLAFAEEELSEFDLEECESEKLCTKCESSGCINLKIRSTREALASLTPTGRPPADRTGV